MAIAGEVSAARLRAKSLAIGFTFNYCFSTVMNVIMPYLFNQDQLDLGGKIGWIFAIMGFISIIIVFFDVPETKGRTFPELDAMFIERVPTRKFKTHHTNLQDGYGKDAQSTGHSLEMDRREPHAL
jgi:SP family general alpha glucoside:H+ symporter-like MFS transporter